MRKTKSSGLLKYDYITRYLELFSEIDIFLQKLECTMKQRKKLEKQNTIEYLATPKKRMVLDNELDFRTINIKTKDGKYRISIKETKHSSMMKSIPY